MNKQTKKRICFSAIAALFVVFMVGETFAYNWTQIEQVTNEFETGRYSTSLEEEFVAPDNWLPGQYVNKDVSVWNDGTVPVFAKIEIDQEWIRRENVYDVEGDIVKPEAGEKFELSFATEAGEEYASEICWGEEVVILSSGVSKDLSLGLPVVDTVEEAKGKWLLLEEDTDGSFVFYYMGVLDCDSETPFLVDGVEMNPKIRAVTTEKHTVWDKASEKWVTTTVQNSTNDYENGIYTLGVTMSTVQATSQAVLEMFGSDKVSEQVVISYLQTNAITGSDITYARADVEEKCLYLRESDGELCYIPSAPEENWFMSFFNMIPGEAYQDSMVIDNQTSNAYHVYMQAINKETQEQMAEELLDYIKMTVFYNGEVIFDGTASGEDQNNTLFDVIPLGQYLAGEQNLIEVRLTLDKDIPMEYANILAVTDWQFMVEEDVTITQPETGDANDWNQYLILMLVASVGLCICLRKIKLLNRI